MLRLLVGSWAVISKCNSSCFISFYILNFPEKNFLKGTVGIHQTKPRTKSLGSNPSPDLLPNARTQVLLLVSPTVYVLSHSALLNTKNTGFVKSVDDLKLIKSVIRSEDNGSSSVLSLIKFFTKHQFQDFSIWVSIMKKLGKKRKKKNLNYKVSSIFFIDDFHIINQYSICSTYFG